MKITVSARLEFDMPISGEEIRVLITLSERHYDAHCRSISRPGGFLIGWRNMWDFGNELNVSDEFRVTARWSEIDTLLKILEMRSMYLRNHSERQKEIASELNMRFHRILNMGRDTQTEWQKVIEI